MNMYQSGEIHEVMKSFETALKASPIYVGGNCDRADMVETEKDGRLSKQYKNSNYYNNGNVNNMFILFFHGYSVGKCAERMGFQ